MKCENDNLKHIGKRIHKVSNQIKRSLDGKMSDYGLTHSQHTVLSYLARNQQKDIFQKNIEEEFDIRRSSVSSILTHLEQKGFITRESVKRDARLKKLTITPYGLDVAQKMHKIVMSFENKINCTLTKEEIDMLINVLDKLSYIANKKEEEK